VSIVTVAPSAKTPPFDTAAVFNVTEAPARMFPEKLLPAPNVAEVPTCQNTLQASPPPVIKTLEPADVIKDVPIWKYQASVEDPVPAKVKVPVIAAEVLKL